MTSPHVPIHGNYRGYYTKRPSAHDPRLSLLPDGLFSGKRVLDIGCNEGWVTCEIAQLGVEQVVGVDVDDTLIRAAWRRRRTVWSRQGITEQEMAVKGRQPDLSRLTHVTGQGAPDFNYFPSAFEHMFGPLPIPPRESGTNGHFPHNVIFRTADWLKTRIVEDENGYDVVLALSITKWIHLNEGDDGILCLFRRVFSVLHPGGAFVLEPQEWETYAKAKRLDNRLKENAKQLTLRPDNFRNVLEGIGFTFIQNLGTTGKGGLVSQTSSYVSKTSAVE
ncbi:Bin3-domain-containing protein [Rickenella mellea]|uniref:RNA methyltransferase n=1 Tax=Rickenella mellea TaxID=50990 RepID=A0A4Y7PW24_9AGAM|nr:Bin3-domain-containing protein [Rickenella mellea]